jgi:hypothetical protein
VDSSRIIFTATKRFDRSCGDAWDKYVGWSKLTHLREVVSLDTILCHHVIQELREEDWNHNVHADYRLYYFRDLDYLMRRVGSLDAVNILALADEPGESDLAWLDGRFAFQGFDLVEDQTGISALTNCGGFDKVFSPGDLAPNGLVRDLHRARDIQQSLRRYYPDEPHADCILWAIWRMR